MRHAVQRLDKFVRQSSRCRARGRGGIPRCDERLHASRCPCRGLSGDAVEATPYKGRSAVIGDADPRILFERGILGGGRIAAPGYLFDQPQYLPELRNLLARIDRVGGMMTGGMMRHAPPLAVDR